MRRAVTAALWLLVVSCADRDLIVPSNYVVIPPVSSTVDPDQEEYIYAVPETMPTFPGGLDEMWAFIESNLEYPNYGCWEGRVYIAFVVNKDGSLSDFEIPKGMGSPFDEKALEVVRKMPAWSPGLQNGIPVRVKMVFPIRFYR